MKKLIISIVALLVGLTLQSQTVVYQEGFEGLSPAVTSSGSPGWSVNDTLYKSGAKSYSAPNYFAGDSSVLITDAFSTLGSLVVTLEFSHICKIEFMDAGEIYVSNDNGVTWTQLTEVHYRGISGFSASSGNKFTSTAYVKWLPGNPTLPNNTWWEDEVFDISALAGNAANVRIKFVVRDLNNGTQFDNWGWALDDIKVAMPALQEASIEEITLPFGLSSGCGLESEVIQVRIANNGGQNISGNLTATFQREGLLPVSEQVSTLMIPGDTLTYTFTNTIDLFSLQDTTYAIKAWITLLSDPNQGNDTIAKVFNSRVAKPYPVVNDTTIAHGTSVTLKASHSFPLVWYADFLGANVIHYGSAFTTPVLYDTAVFYVQAIADQSGAFFITEVCQNRSATGAPVGGWPSYLMADDYIEITGAPGSDLYGFTLEQWSTSALLSSHTFPTGTFLSPSGTAVIAVGELGLSVPDPLNYYYHGNGTYTGSFIPSGLIGRIIKDPAGVIIDAVGYGNYNFPALADVTTQDWSGYTPGYTGSGNRLVGLYTKDATHWVNSGTSPQDPNTLNAGVVVPSPGGCSSKIKPVHVYVSGMPMNDAGVAQVNSPVGVLSTGVAYPVEVVIRNFGVQPIAKVNIHHSINGIAQPVYAWTGNLTYGSQSASFVIGSYMAVTGVTNVLAWTSMPNDSIDWATHNDTMQAVAYTCLSGTISIGGPGADFTDFDALSKVIDLVGFCGPTVIEFNPGNYSGQVVMNAAMGIIDSTAVTIRSATQNAADVIIEYAAADAAENYVLLLDGASYVTVENITFKATGGAFGRVVEFANGANYNVLRGCILKTVVNATSGSFAGIYSTSNNPSNYNLIENNTILGGYYGIEWNGSSGHRKTGTTIRNNIVKGFGNYGINSYFSDSVSIVGNTLYSSSNASTLYALSCRQNRGYGLVDKNRVVCTSTGTLYAIDIGFNTSSITSGVLQVSNNYVHQSVGTGTTYGLHVTTCNHTVNVYNNTIELTGGHLTGGRSLFQTMGTGMVNFLNNVFHNSGGGYAYYVNTPSQVGLSDYNNLYSSGSSLAYWGGARANLGALKTASAKDANSVSTNTGFIIPGQPYVLDYILDGAGTPLSSVPFDIDGKPRSPINPDIGAVEFVISPNDAGVFSLISPEAPCPGDTVDVVVRLYNFGSAPLTSCGIQWLVNGVAQDSVVFSGNMASASYQDVVVGSYVFNVGIMYDVLAYSTYPNSAADMNNGNDTMFAGDIQVAIPSGVYTVGGAGADFPTLDMVLQRLYASGICGPVTFSINNGIYNTNMLLEGIKGISAVNTLTFQSTSKDSSAVVIQYSSSSFADNYVVKLSGISHVTFRQLTLRALGNSFAKIVEISGGSHYNTFTGCFLKNSPNITSTNSGGVYAVGIANNHNTFRGNVILGGYTGIHFYGLSTNVRGSDLVIENNQILSSYYYAIHVSNFDSVTFNGNRVTSATNSGTTYGARLLNSNFVEVVGNNIQIAGSGVHYGLYFSNCYGTATQRNLIANNFVSLNGTGSGNWWGVFFSGMHYTDFYHNSIHNSNGAGLANYTFHQIGAGTDINIVNNIFTNTGNGFVYNITTPAAIQTSNHNNYYATGSKFAFWSAARADLAALQSANGQDFNSISVDPQYMSNKNLHILSAALKGAGTPLASVPFDIDGEPRSTTNPDIGADEFINYGLISELIDYQTLFGGCGFDSTLVSVNFKNIGVDTIDASSNLMFSFMVNQGTPVQESFTGVLLPGDTASFTFSAYAYFPVTLPQDSVFHITTWINIPGGLTVNDTLYSFVWNGYQPPAPIVNDTIIPYGTSATLHASSHDAIVWYNSPNAQNSLATGYTYTTPDLFAPATYWVEGIGSGISGDIFMITEICHYKTSTGAPVGGWPPYLFADDYIEITGAPGADLAGFTLEQWDASTMLSRYTFPAGTVMSPSGSAIIAVGQLGASVPVPSNFYYHGTGLFAGSFGATNITGRILKDSTEKIIDAVGYGNYTFPASAGVTPFDWSGSTPSVVCSGNRLVGAYTKDAANWINSVTQPQDPNIINAGVTVPLEFGCPSARTPIKVYLSGMPAYDLGISKILMAEGCVSNEPLTIEIYNQGTDTLFVGGQVAYRINNGPGITPENINIPVAPGDTILHIFNAIPGINPANDTLFKVTAWVSVVGDPYQGNDTLVKDSLIGLHTPPFPLVNDVAIPYATNAILTAQSNSIVVWYAQETDTVEIATGTSFTTPILLATTTYWVAARSGTQASGCVSARMPVTVTVGSPSPIDAGIFSVVNPMVSVPSGTNQNIDVTVRNYGTNVLTSFTLTYELNGIVKGSYNWTGSIPSAGLSQPITVYTDNFAAGVHNMRVWVSNANGTTQGVNANDTIINTFVACLSGTYTLGGATSDFATFGDAMLAIQQVGPCGHVTFMVQPGIYTEQLLFNANTNIDANSTITFQGSTGDSTQVTLQYAASTAGDNFVVKLNDASHISFKHMTIKATGGSFGYAVYLNGESSFNEFLGNVIQVPMATSTDFSGIYMASSLGGNNLIQGNRILGGYYGIYWHGTSNAIRAKNNHFIDNEIRDFYYYGAKIAYVDSLLFNGNDIKNGTNSGLINGVRLDYCDYIQVVGNNIAIAGASTHYGIYLNYNDASAAHKNLVANNFVNLSGTGVSEWYGIYFFNQINTNLYHNTVHHTGGSTGNGGCLYVSNGATNNVVNNIFSNEGGGYAYYLTSPGAIVASNYNNFHVTANKLAYWGGTISTLAALRTASGKETNSLAVDPQFYSSTNLHVLSSLLNGAGTSLPSVPFDIDGEPRDPLTPDIGADEFSLSQKDLGVKSLASPFSDGCFGANETVVLQVKNYGLATLNFAVSPATITASATGVNPVTFPTVSLNTGTLIPGATLDVVVATNYNMSVNGQYTFHASATVVGDGNTVNDVMIPVSMNITATVATFPYIVDFEGSTAGTPSVLNNGWMAAPTSSWAYAWFVQSGATNSTLTGPGGDHTSGNGKYIYTEASSGVAGAEAFLTSPCMDISTFTNPVMRFWYHMHGSTMGELYIQALDSSGNWVNLSTITGQHHFSEFDPWTQHTVDLTAFKNNNTRVRFKAVRGSNYYGDMAIDDILIHEPFQLDAGIKAVLKPSKSYSNAGSSQLVDVVAQNFGFATVTKIPVAYRYNGGTIHRDTVYSNFGLDSAKSITFAAPFTVVSGDKLLEIWTELQGDMFVGNDTLTFIFMGLDVKSVPFCDDFEGPNAWARDGSFDQWEHGAPSGSVINTAHSGINSWAVNLSGPHLDNSIEYLYSPYFDFSGFGSNDTATVEFWHWMDVDTTSGYGQVQYSLNGGQSWSVLGFYNDPNSINWYNTTIGGMHFFSSPSTGWQYSSYKLLPGIFNQSNLVQLRFRFFSNPTISNYEGWAIDDFCVTLPIQPNDVGVSAINHPANDTAVGSLVSVEVTIKNYGTNTQTTFPVELSLDGIGVVTDTWSGNLPGLGTTTHTFSVPYTVPAVGYHLCARTYLANDSIPTNDQFCKTFGVLPAYDDAGISAIISPLPDSVGNICMYNAQLQPWNQYNVVVRIENYGQNTQISIPVKYNFHSGGTVYTDTWTGSLAPNAYVDFTLSNLFKPDNGLQQLCVETDLASDILVTNNKACQAYTGVLCVGMEDQVAERFVLLQNIPNPATGITSISYLIPRGGEVTIGVVNMVGQVMHQESVVVTAGKQQTELDISSFAAGVYYYYVEFERQQLTKKLVVRH